ncbi:MAG: mechanosensitive ion channel [Thermoproteota archaeon]|jgi:small-conductance mechanosensitive channel|nr:mechanosensitive ion channel [Thermoproteota archaeon]
MPSTNSRLSKAGPKAGTLRQELVSLAIRTTIVIVLTWAVIYLFQSVLAQHLGITNLHIHISESVATIAISFVLITTLRRIIHRSIPMISQHMMAVISSFVVILISLIAIIVLMNLWNFDPQTILVGGGVVAIVVGIALSTIVGNLLSGGLVLTTFPSKIGDTVFIVNDNIRGVIEEVSLLYTKVITDAGSEYFVPNTAVVQGNVRLIKEGMAIKDQLPFVEGDHVELASSSVSRYVGTVSKITPRFSTLITDDDSKEVMLSNSSIISGQFVIVKDRTKIK